MPKQWKDLDTGVYVIVNTVTNKMYVGSTTSSFKNRWNKHKSDLRAKSHGNEDLQSDWETYGEEAFELLVVKACPKEKCVELEQYYLDEYVFFSKRCGSRFYNKSRIAVRVPFGRKVSSEIGIKISKAKIGIKFSEQHKAAMSKAWEKRRLKGISEETRAKMSIARSNYYKKKKEVNECIQSS